MIAKKIGHDTVHLRTDDGRLMGMSPTDPEMGGPCVYASYVTDGDRIRDLLDKFRAASPEEQSEGVQLWGFCDKGLTEYMVNTGQYPTANRGEYTFGASFEAAFGAPYNPGTLVTLAP